MERNPDELIVDPQDVAVPSVDMVFPYEDLSLPFKKALNRYMLLDEEALLKAAAKLAKGSDDTNQFIDVNFEDLFNIPLTDGNAYNAKVSGYLKEGRVDSSGSQLEVVSINLEYDQIEASKMIISVPAPLPPLTTGTTVNVQSPPTVTSNPQHGLPSTPSVDHASVLESLLNTQAAITISGNLFSKGASFGPSGGSVANTFFSMPVRSGSTEDRSDPNVVILNTAEDNHFYLYTASANGHLLGDYVYEITHAVPHLLNNGDYDVDKIGPNLIFNEHFIYSLTNSFFETNIGMLSFHIVDDVPLAANQSAGVIQEADILTIGTSGANTIATTVGGLLDPPNTRFGADGGTVSNVTITGGSTVIGANIITVTTAEGNTLVVDQLNASYTYSLLYPLQNTNDQNIDEVFTYEFTDGDGSIASATLTVTVADDIPIATNKTNSVSETALFVNGSETTSGNLITDNNGFGLLLFGADGGAITSVNGATDASDGLVDGVIHASTTYGDITVYITKQGIHAAGKYQYTLDSAKTTPVNDALGTVTDTISYVITDNDGSQDSANLAVTVTLNQAPTAVDDTNATDENVVLNVLAINGVLVNDTDPNAGDTKIISKVNGSALNVGAQITLASNALLQLNANGSYSYDPNGAYDYLAQGSSTTDSFTYTMHDAEGLTSSATVTITINGVNSAPVAVDDTNSTNADTVITVNTLVDVHNLLINDTDDVGDTHVISKVAGLAANVGNQFALPSGALLTVNSDGTYIYDPNGVFDSLGAGASTTDTFAYTIEDSGGLTSSANVTITINGVNEAPVANDDTNTTDAVTVINVNTVNDPNNLLINDTDIDVGDTFSISAVEGSALNVGNQFALASGALVTVNADGTYSYDPNSSFASLGVGASTTDTFAYTIEDSGGLTSNANVTITINGVNDAPVASDDNHLTHGAVVLDVNTALDPHNLLVISSDVDVGDTFTVSKVAGFAANVGNQFALPSGALLTVNSDGTYSYDPNGAFAATDTDSFTYEVTDNHGLASNTATVTIDVIVPPIILDLNDDGIALISPSDSDVQFNLLGRSEPSTIGWVSGEEGILAIDLNNDGIINGLEEFTFTHPNAKTDLAALRELYDSNLDGILDMNDADWLRFGVWQDSNENGICEPGEFLSLAERGISSISLISDQQIETVNGNTIFGMGTYQTTDDQLHQLADVGLGLF